MNSRLLPLWILIISGIFAVMELMVGITLFVMPEQMLENVDFNSQGAYFLAQSWATRQFALGALFAFAMIKKSSDFLAAAYFFMLVMFLGDIAVGISQQEKQAIIAGAMMVVVSSIMLYFLIGKKQ